MVIVSCVYKKKENNNGNVMQDKRWDTITRPLAIGFASPYALGITTMFIPKGIEMDTTAQIYVTCDIGIKERANANTAGIATRRIRERV